MCDEVVMLPIEISPGDRCPPFIDVPDLIVGLVGLREGEEFVAKTGQKKRFFLTGLRREIGEGLKGGDSAEEEDISFHFLKKSVNLLGL